MTWFLALSLLSGLAVCRTVHESWNVTWINAAPDGFERRVIGINGHFPCPTLNLNKGDRVVVDVYNGLGDQDTSIHWHGIYQRGTPYMDGAVGASQCGIPPGSSMTYDFEVNQSGTYWYHSHDEGQYPDGLWGPIIVHDEAAIAPYNIDEEVILTLTDWYHEEMAVLSAQYQSTQNVENNQGNEPTPDVALINMSPNTQIHVEPNKTYLVRVICVGNWPGHAFLFDQHDMTVVEVDGVWIEPYKANLRNVRIATGQRMSVLIHTKNNTDANYAIWDTMDINMLFFNEGKNPSPNYNPNVTAHLVYNNDAELPPPPSITKFDFIEDIDFRPADAQPLLEPVDHYLEFSMKAVTLEGLPKYEMNNETWFGPKTPSLYSAMDNPTNLTAYGNVAPVILKYGEIVQVAINNHEDPKGKNNLHPFHLHGHVFQVLQRTQPNQGPFTSIWANVSSTPLKRDTIMVQNGGHAVIRFRADNPGVWLFHCHIEWHVEAGLVATFIEAPEELGGLRIPQQHRDLCAPGGNGTSIPPKLDPLREY